MMTEHHACVQYHRNIFADPTIFSFPWSSQNINSYNFRDLFLKASQASLQIIFTFFRFLRLLKHHFSPWKQATLWPSQRHDIFMKHWSALLLLLSAIESASKLQSNVSIFLTHTYTQGDICTHIKHSTMQSTLLSNVKKLSEWEKRPLNWRDISQPASTHLYCFTVLSRRWGVCVFAWVSESVCESMHWSHTEGQEHWGCDDCFAIHML